MDKKACPECGFPLTENPGPKCPECGYLFDADKKGDTTDTPTTEQTKHTDGVDPHQETNNTCPECGRVLENGKECPNCGCPISGTTSSDKQLIPCCDCGHMVAVDATVCPKCGGHLSTKASQGRLRILMFGNQKNDMRTAPVYINGQMIEAVLMSNGCDITIPINNSNITIGYKAPIAYVEHSYKLNLESNYTLVITNGADLGFTLYNSSNKKELSSDKMDVSWLLFSVLFGVFAILISFKETNSKPILSKCLRIYGLLIIGILISFLGLSIAL